MECFEKMDWALLENAGVDFLKNQPASLLFRAIYFGRSNLVFQILKIPNLDINLHDSNGNSALRYAIFYPNEKIALEILNMPNVDIMKYCSVDRKYVSPLNEACSNRMYNVVLRLLELGMNPLELGMNPLEECIKCTPLHLVSEHNRKDIVILLLDHGVDVNKQDSYGNTPLMVACSSRQFEIVNILLNRGAKLETKNNFGQNAFDLINSKKIRDLFELIKD
jgi:ankyrin repeat protein